MKSITSGLNLESDIQSGDYRINYEISSSDRSQPLIILTHGYMAHKDGPNQKGLREMLQGNGFGTLSFNLPGHGNEIDHTQEGFHNFAFQNLRISHCVDILEDVISHARSEHSFDKIGLAGSSTGALFNMVAASRDPSIYAMALYSAATDVAALAEKKVGYAALFGLFLKKFHPNKTKRAYIINNGEREWPYHFGFYWDARKFRGSDLPQIDVPTMFLHGEDDQIVPIEQPRRMVDIMPASHLVSFPEGDHGFTNEQDREKAAEHIAEFFKDPKNYLKQLATESNGE